MAKTKMFIKGAEKIDARKTKKGSLILNGRGVPILIQDGKNIYFLTYACTVRNIQELRNAWEQFDLRIMPNSEETGRR